MKLRNSYLIYRTGVRHSSNTTNTANHPNALSYLRSTSSFSADTSSPPQINVFRTPAELRPYRNTLRTLSHSVGLVPTMGAFHAGHLSLARTAAAENHDVFVSIYVNPTQFGVSEDLASYPRTFTSDLQKLDALNADLAANHPHHGRVTAVFAPTTQIMYPTLPPSSEPQGAGSFITITPLGSLLEGASRPIFFRGVATVCAKLFNIVSPTAVYFGQKDFQQTAVIRRLVKDFHIDTALRIIPTEREHDGLAMSSRNVFLGARRRAVAAVLPKALEVAESMYPQHLTHEAILQPARDYITVAATTQALKNPSERARIELEYISLADPETMEEVEVVDASKGAVISAAVRMLPVEDVQEGEDTGQSDGGERVIRLIDNILLPPVEAAAAAAAVDGSSARQ